ncbi:receptor/non-receptor type protein-tyrosine phosphatase [Coemansia reversa NRRL 1564]|uniref:Receptor/non-receptor type protein-tyrosine phosphatase n=1 Tax=Coemansia reversa (strain ATCC 12441 / NRRL 1564) TaxID=763665 RepID=A0A2G5BE34_COERN|nr:receptor/non-receptor type protein-tyrosine phosphatase [Coemansia reversa NRRL 1564]|eukprot:PIA17279.1 receptor/non-receptor type protein-tyrosine phosphatase [Coemansia reversa NRRL 1564]
MMTSLSFQQLVGALHKQGVKQALAETFQTETEKDRERMEQTDVTSDAQKGSNFNLNRYNDVLPFNHNRVRLAGKNDYINASHIELPAQISGYRYIATQGPLSHSVADFWRLVWEQRATTIVMLANPYEAGRSKCSVYWPQQINTQFKKECFTITLSSERKLELCPSVVVRKLLVQNSSEGDDTRTVTQLHFTGWPDHGVPSSPLPMLRMIKELRENIQPPSDVPVVVHCSAGVGRSGSFMVIDAAVGYLAQHSDYSGDLVADLFKSLRSQRTLMVQTLSQYMLCYEAINFKLNNNI